MTAAAAYGINPIHFGVMMVINPEIGFLTSPIGLNLIVAMTAFKEKFGEICLAVLPFIGIIFVVLMLVTFFPGEQALAALTANSSQPASSGSAGR